jgi:hypothetical protein
VRWVAAISATIFNSCTTIYATFDPYRQAQIGWSPETQSYYSSVSSGLNIATTWGISRPLLSWLGSRRTYEASSLVAAVAYCGVGFACRPLGASALRKTLQLVFWKTVLMTPWSEPARFAINPMVRRRGWKKSFSSPPPPPHVLSRWSITNEICKGRLKWLHRRGLAAIFLPVAPHPGASEHRERSTERARPLR